MKLMVCGKGGSGKSTVAALMTRVLAGMGREVVVVDSDESNTTLHRMLGLESPKPLAELLGGRKAIAKALATRREEDLLRALARGGRSIVVDELPPEYVAGSGNVKLVVVGKIREFGEGCACPLNFLAKVFLRHLSIGDNTVVIVDTDAGVEHVGRGVEEAVDKILAVIDPTHESLIIAETLMRTASRLGKGFHAILNKVRESTLPLLLEEVRKRGIRVDGWIRYHEELEIQALRGSPISCDEALNEVREIVEKLLGGATPSPTL